MTGGSRVAALVEVRRRRAGAAGWTEWHPYLALEVSRHAAAWLAAFVEDGELDRSDAQFRVKLAGDRGTMAA